MRCQSRAFSIGIFSFFRTEGQSASREIGHVGSIPKMPSSVYMNGWSRHMIGRSLEGRRQPVSVSIPHVLSCVLFRTRSNPPGLRVHVNQAGSYSGSKYQGSGASIVEKSFQPRKRDMRAISPEVKCICRFVQHDVPAWAHLQHGELIARSSHSLGVPQQKRA
jgi:hypothetical protein